MDISDETAIKIAALVLDEDELYHPVVNRLEDAGVKFVEVYDAAYPEESRDIIEIDQAWNINSKFGGMCNMVAAYKFIFSITK